MHIYCPVTEMEKALADIDSLMSSWQSEPYSIEEIASMQLPRLLVSSVRSQAKQGDNETDKLTEVEGSLGDNPK